MEDSKKHAAGVFVEVRCASKVDAYHKGGFTSTKWAQPARVWVRTYDEAGRKVGEVLVDFIDKRHTGPRSRAYEVLMRADEIAAGLRAGRRPQWATA